MTKKQAKKGRLVNVYIDGYNFYYSIKHHCETSGWNDYRLGWCDFGKLAVRLAAREFPGSTLGAVKYFTATVPEDLEMSPGERERQDYWIRALTRGAAQAIHVVRGFYAPNDRHVRKEKLTDVNVVTNLIGDSLLGNLYGSEYDYHACDEVILISSDRDFRPALEMTARHKVPSVTYFNLGPGNVPKATHAGLVQWRKLSLEDLRACTSPIRFTSGTALRSVGKAISPCARVSGRPEPDTDLRTL